MTQTLVPIFQYCNRIRVVCSSESVVLACLDNLDVVDLVSRKQSGLLVVERSLVLGKVLSE
jgi:hypothetical protein